MAVPGPGLSLIPEDGNVSYALATQLFCWAQTEDGVIDPRIQFLTCKAGRYYYIPPEVCADYGPLPFTSEGNEITCDPDATHQMDRTIWPEDIAPLNVDTCTGEGVTLATPTGVTAGTVTDTEISLTWTGVPGAAEYTVRHRTEGGAWTEVTSVTPDATIGGLTAETTYEIQVKASNTEGGYTDSAWSASLFVTTTAAP
jgi:Fibronectin type III domain